MQFSFHGAVREVTGSCHLVETGGVRFLVDCGMFQGTHFASRRNADAFSFDPASIDFVLLTHAHMDHCGRLPKLLNDGFKGTIYCTPATRDFAQVMLLDSAHVIAVEAASRGIKPLYTQADVEALAPLYKTIDYRTPLAITPNITATYHDAGHILGSAFVELEIREGEKTTRVVFSGDLGNPPVPLLEDTEFIDGADIVVIESTYGGRIHEPGAMRQDMLRQAFQDTIDRKGTLLIPAFALERTQEVLYELNALVEKNLVERMPVFIDSPLAIRATNVYRQYRELYDAESQKLLDAGDDIFNFPGLHYTPSGHESRAIANVPGPKLILAGGGMCNGGRIVGHLEHYLPDPKTHLLIIGYQPERSIGRQLLDGANEVLINGQLITSRAKVSAIGAYSAHGDQPKLLHWVKQMTNPKPRQVFVVHGEVKANEMLADGLHEKLGLTATIPEYGEAYDM